MKQFKWMPVSQLIKTKTKSEPKQRRLFTDDGDNSRASLGMDEDSNMSNISTASDSMDGLTQLTAKPEEKVQSHLPTNGPIGFLEVDSVLNAKYAKLLKQIMRSAVVVGPPNLFDVSAVAAGWGEADDNGVS